MYVWNKNTEYHIQYNTMNTWSLKKLPQNTIYDTKSSHKHYGVLVLSVP